MTEPAKPEVSARAREDFQPTQQQTRYLTGLSKTGTLTAGVKAARVSHHTVYRWREDEAFTEAEGIARDIFTDGLEQEAVRRAWRGTKKVRPIYVKGELVGEMVETEYSDTLMVLMLKALRPDKYRERRTTELTGADGGPIQTEDVGLSDNERATRILAIVQRARERAAEIADSAEPNLGAPAGSTDGSLAL